jgi:hypothetical protein
VLVAFVVPLVEVDLVHAVAGVVSATVEVDAVVAGVALATAEVGEVDLGEDEEVDGAVAPQEELPRPLSSRAIVTRVFSLPVARRMLWLPSTWFLAKEFMAKREFPLMMERRARLNTEFGTRSGPSWLLPSLEVLIRFT